jgi:quercetin dioxygenase-like cupin family protein
MTFDHELKIRRAFNHLYELDGLIKAWLDGNHHSVRQGRDP